MTALPALERGSSIHGVDLTRATKLDLKPGEELTLSGSVVTKSDGSVFDASTRTDIVANQRVARPGGILELEGTGLSLVAQDSTGHIVHLVASGEAAPRCAELGTAGPCLVPRTKILAHERLMTETEFVSSLSGTLEVSLPPVAMTSALNPWLKPIGRGALGLGLAMLIAFGIAAIVRYRNAPLQVLARQAKRTRTALLKRREYVALVPHVVTLEGKARALFTQLETLTQRLKDPTVMGTPAWETWNGERNRVQAAVSDVGQALALLETKATIVDLGADLDVQTAKDELALLESAAREADSVLR